MGNTLRHHGVKGQKWGIRRYQHPDGTWTNAGKKRYEDSSESGKKISGDTKKKAAIGVAAGAAIVTGIVLTAYLVKKHGAKHISDIGEKASAGKEVFENLLKAAPVASTPVSQISTPKVEPKQVLEKAVKSAAAASESVSQFSAPRVSVDKPSSEISSAYGFDSLIRQNDDLLKKMLAGLG